jgi:uncharacterized membrane protein
MHTILGLFQDAAQAQAAVQALLADQPTLHAANVGVVSKGPDGQISFLDIAEEREIRRFSTIGRVTGWLLGAASAVVGAPLPIWQTATAGDLVATDAAIRHDAGFSDQELRHLGEHLHAGSTAVLILTDQEASEPIAATLEQLGGTVYQGALPSEVEAALTADQADDRS